MVLVYLTFFMVKVRVKINNSVFLFKYFCIKVSKNTKTVLFDVIYRIDLSRVRDDCFSIYLYTLFHYQTSYQVFLCL